MITALILLSYALARQVTLPTRVIETTLFGSSIGIEINGQTILLLLVAGLISSGSDALIRSHPRVKSQTTPVRTVVHWILPGLAALALGLLLNLAPLGPIWWLGLLLSATFLVGLLLAEYTVVDREDPAFRAARLGLTALAYVVALALFGWIRFTGTRAALSASGTALIAGLISFRLLVLNGATLRRSLLNGAAVGLILGQCMWALNYWIIQPVGAGLVLLDIFYLAHGLIQQNISRPVRGRIVAEYLIVGGVGLGLALQFAFRGLV